MFKHVEIVTDQPDRTIQFYTEVLGFKVRSRERVVPSGGGAPLNLAYLELGGTTVELITYEGAKVAPAPTGRHLGYNLALEVDDMQTTIEYLKTKGVGVVWGPLVRENRFARAEITDPNGYHTELRQWLQPAQRI